MASSNRHWPSLFKSKPCSQPWHDINTPPLLSTTTQRSPFSSGCEERSPEPKPRWNPKPEQIRILEAIFNSGMVNPPREEIHRIRVQLQQYGQVGDANVFYWFQNRKSRTKSKHRQNQNQRNHCRASIASINTPSHACTANINIESISTGFSVGAQNNVFTNSVASPSTPMNVSITMTIPTSSPSSSSERSSGSSKPLKPTHAPMSILDPLNQIYNNFHGSVGFSSTSEPSFFFQNPHVHCFSIPELTGLIAAPEHQTSECLGLWSEPIGCTGVATGENDGDKYRNEGELHHGLGLWNELMNQAGCKSLPEDENGEDKVKIGLHHDCSFALTNPVADSTVTESVITASVPASTGVSNVIRCGNTVTASPPIELQGFGNGGRTNGVGGRLTVFINDVAFDMPAARMNVKSAFGPNAILMHASGYPVPTDELANTLQPLQHGAAYYVV